MKVECHDCGLSYDDPGFQDLIIPREAWLQISPPGDRGGLLCANCICGRLHMLGMRCSGAFMSGPIESVSKATMNLLRRVEKLEISAKKTEKALRKNTLRRKTHD